VPAIEGAAEPLSLISREPRTRLADDFAPVLIASTFGSLAVATIAAILRLSAILLPFHRPLIPVAAPLNLPAIALPTLLRAVLAAALTFTRSIAAVAALAGLTVRSLAALHALARTISPFRAIHTRGFALNPGLGALRSRLGPFRSAAHLAAAAVPGIRAG
jgi:hypothetical protein